MSDVMQELDAFLSSWEDSGTRTKDAFIRLKDHLAGMDGVTLDFKARPGVSYSLRPVHANQKEQPLFAMVDVIDDDPAERWLSVCFYGDMISDPDEAGDFVPGGLLGQDGHCFDLDEWDDAALEYLEARLSEAHAYAASKGK